MSGEKDGIDNPVREKSFAFAIRVVGLYKYLVNEKKEFVLSKQLLKSGTSIGANVEEGIGGISRKDFRAKLSIAYKEARETKYWLKLLHATDYIDEKAFDSMIEDCEELLKILYVIVKKAGE
ncbi:four helix bundle protein [Tunicatimonas pelagia]|uniref:four helix bundle protein n=1 Tax=Tunicatimonas pelagia TaxID=931531 RepID=UPI00266586F1|nr:four helix bundle protein [Tunicatimonas pelagia]WKN40504.1 four helix bundle protein [Tunicatimonas pelagia]